MIVKIQILNLKEVNLTILYATVVLELKVRVNFIEVNQSGEFTLTHCLGLLFSMGIRNMMESYLLIVERDVELTYLDD